jgi:hypothetical protein
MSTPPDSQYQLIVHLLMTAYPARATLDVKEIASFLKEAFGTKGSEEVTRRNLKLAWPQQPKTKVIGSKCRYPIIDLARHLADEFGEPPAAAGKVSPQSVRSKTNKRGMPRLELTSAANQKNTSAEDRSTGRGIRPSTVGFVTNKEIEQAYSEIATWELQPEPNVEVVDLNFRDQRAQTRYEKRVRDHTKFWLDVEHELRRLAAVERAARTDDGSEILRSHVTRNYP